MAWALALDMLPLRIGATEPEPDWCDYREDERWREARLEWRNRMCDLRTLHTGDDLREFLTGGGASAAETSDDAMWDRYYSVNEDLIEAATRARGLSDG